MHYWVPSIFTYRLRFPATCPDCGHTRDTNTLVRLGFYYNAATYGTAWSCCALDVLPVRYEVAHISWIEDAWGGALSLKTFHRKLSGLYGEVGRNLFLKWHKCAFCLEELDDQKQKPIVCGYCYLYFYCSNACLECHQALHTAECCFLFGKGAQLWYPSRGKETSGVGKLSEYSFSSKLQPPKAAAVLKKKKPRRLDSLPPLAASCRGKNKIK